MQTQERVLVDYPFPDERVFRYQAMQDILHHLVTNPGEAFTQQELATLTGADVSSISRSVDLLDRLGVLEITGGKPRTIALDPDHVVDSNPVNTIPQAEFRAPARAFTDELASRIDASDEVAELVGVLCFGSVARGAADRRSDIDLLVIVEGDLTYGRRIASTLARELEDRSFDGDRYGFDVLVETPDSAESHGDSLREIFDDGIVLARSESLPDVRTKIYRRAEEGD